MAKEDDIDGYWVVAEVMDAVDKRRRWLMVLCDCRMQTGWWRLARAEVMVVSYSRGDGGGRKGEGGQRRAWWWQEKDSGRRG